MPKQFFLDGMKKALASIAKQRQPTPRQRSTTRSNNLRLSEDGVTSAGWASFLQAVVDSGLAVDGTWPMRTELSEPHERRSINALASSIVLVCRRRDATASTITRADFLRALRREMPAALAEIRRAGVGPTDIQQAAIGPGIGIFTRYAEVLNTDGTPMLVKDALKLINQVREEITSTGDADYDSETRFALDWFAAKGFEKGKSGDAIVMTNAVNVSLDGMNAAGFFEAQRRRCPAPKARANCPTTGTRPQTVAAPSGKPASTSSSGSPPRTAASTPPPLSTIALGALAEPAHALARRLYDICEQKQWASEGRVYNQLHQEWAVIEKRAAELAETRS